VVGSLPHNTPHTHTHTHIHALVHLSLRTCSHRWPRPALPRGPETVLSYLPAGFPLSHGFSQCGKPSINGTFHERLGSRVSERWQHAVELGRVWEEAAVT